MRFREDVRAGDVEAVRALVAATGFFRSDEIAVAVELAEERLTRGAASGYSFIFAECRRTEDGPEALAGYACWGPIPCTLTGIDLYWIVVHPDLQGGGLGRELAGRVETAAAAAGGRRIYAETSGTARYAPTRAFYRKIGYVEAARLEEFYAPGDDKVIYAKTLIPIFPGKAGARPPAFPGKTLC